MMMIYMHPHTEVAYTFFLILHFTLSFRGITEAEFNKLDAVKCFAWMWWYFFFFQIDGMHCVNYHIELVH